MKFNVKNSGIVIICPFLQAFFSKLNLIENGKFISEDAAIRASLILDYLVTGIEKGNKANFSLNKIICNISNSLNYKNFELSMSEKNECEALLKAVIQHWTILKDTNIKTFQDSFLKRPGVLEITENYFLLNVKNKGIDILLNQIPWNYSKIKLPWMEKIIEVNWWAGGENELNLVIPK